MTKEDKANLQNHVLTVPIVISCLVTCETVIGKNAYLEKKWKNAPYLPGEEIGGLEYKEKRLEWMAYREKLRSLLIKQYSMNMKQIIQITKSCTDKATQKDVKNVIDFVNVNDYTLI